MNLVINQPTAVSKGNGSNRESRDKREARIKGSWAAGLPDMIFALGQILRYPFDETRTLAQALAAGEAITDMTEVTICGVVCPIRAGFVLSLATMSHWECIACHSAHGSGKAPSRDISARLLATNQFYYRPDSGELFVVSNTCWDDYIRANGLVPRFVDSNDRRYTKANVQASIAALVAKLDAGKPVEPKQAIAGDALEEVVKDAPGEPTNPETATTLDTPSEPTNQPTATPSEVKVPEAKGKGKR